MEQQDNNQTNEQTVVKNNRRSRIGTTWVALAAFVVILLLLAIFILQNSERVEIKFLGFKGGLAFGVAMLLSAITGSLLILLVGSARILQLRSANNKH